MSYARKFTDQDALALSLIKHCGFVGVAADGTPFLAPGYRVHRKRVRRLIELGALLPKFDGLGGGRSQTYVPADRRGAS